MTPRTHPAMTHRTHPVTTPRTYPPTMQFRHPTTSAPRRAADLPTTAKTSGSVSVWLIKAAHTGYRRGNKTPDYQRMPSVRASTLVYHITPRRTGWRLGVQVGFQHGCICARRRRAERRLGVQVGFQRGCICARRRRSGWRLGVQVVRQIAVRHSRRSSGQCLGVQVGFRYGCIGAGRRRCSFPFAFFPRYAVGASARCIHRRRGTGHCLYAC